MPEFDKEAFWKAIVNGTLKKPAPKPKPTIRTERPAAPVMHISGSCVLLVSKTQCKCGACYVAPNRLMLEYRSENGKIRQMKPLPQGQYPSGFTREVREVESKIDFCQACFLTRGFEAQEETRPSDDNVVQLRLQV